MAPAPIKHFMEKGQQRGHARRLPRAPARQEHRPHRHADHVAQEGVGLDDEDQLVVAPDPLAAREGAVEEDVLGAGRGEGPQVVRPPQELRRGVHRVHVERRGVVEHPSAPERGRWAAEHPVLISARPRVAAGVEPVVHGVHPAHVEVGEKEVVIDDHDVGRVGTGTHSCNKTRLKIWALLANTGLALGVDAAPEREVFW